MGEGANKERRKRNVGARCCAARVLTIALASSHSPRDPDRRTGTERLVRRRARFPRTRNRGGRKQGEVLPNLCPVRRRNICQAAPMVKVQQRDELLAADARAAKHRKVVQREIINSGLRLRRLRRLPHQKSFGPRRIIVRNKKRASWPRKFTNRLLPKVEAREAALRSYKTLPKRWTHTHTSSIQKIILPKG